MYREAVIIVLIILLIIIGDILTHKFTTKTVAEISREIFLLTESVKNIHRKGHRAGSNDKKW